MPPQTRQRTIDIRREVKLCSACGQRFSGDAGFCPFDGTKLEGGTFDPLGDPLVGSTVDGRYQVVALLGEGGMGHVYEVRHVSLDRSFAMKVLRRELAQEEDLAGRFIDEAKATAAVRHANVVQITDFGKLPDGIPYFVMELLAGQTLGQVIKSGGPIPAARAVRIVEQVAGALGAAHAAGIVHRDLKSENVFLVGGASGGVASDDVRVVDFGAAKIIGSSRVTRQGIVFGTPHYMSPEQASGQPVDHRADIYSLGVILYEMFTGKVPFEADTYMGVLTQHMFVAPVPPSRVCEAARELGALEDLTLRCLAKKPEDRFASMKDLVDALTQAASQPAVGRPTSERRGVAEQGPRDDSGIADALEPPAREEPRGPAESVELPRRTLPWGRVAGAASAAAVAVALLAWAWASGKPPARAAAAAVPLSSRGPSPATAPPAAAAAAALPSERAQGPESRGRDPAATAGQPPSAAPVASAKPPAPAPRRAPSPRRPARSMDDVGDPFASGH